MINISLSGTTYPVPSSAADTNWAADQVAWEQAVSAASSYAIRKLTTDVTPTGNGADTTEDVIFTYTLPASTLATNGQAIRVTAFGTGVNTADVTTVRCYFGASSVVTKVLTAAQSNTWRVVFEVWRTGAATQVACGTIDNGGTATSIACGAANPAETLSGAIVVKITGQRASTSTANSVVRYAAGVELVP